MVNCVPQHTYADRAVALVVKNCFSVVRCAQSQIVCHGPRGMVLHLDFASLTFRLKFRDGIELDSSLLTGKVCRRKPEYFLEDLRRLFNCVPVLNYGADGRHTGTVSEWFEDREFGYVECYGRRDFVLQIAEVPAEMRPFLKEGAKIRFRAGKLGPYRARRGCLPATDVVVIRAGVVVEMPVRVSEGEYSVTVVPKLNRR